MDASDRGLGSPTPLANAGVINGNRWAARHSSLVCPGPLIRSPWTYWLFFFAGHPKTTMIEGWDQYRGVILAPTESKWATNQSKGT